jgi:hypothetical protein
MLLNFYDVVTIEKRICKYKVRKRYECNFRKVDVPLHLPSYQIHYIYVIWKLKYIIYVGMQWYSFLFDENVHKMKVWMIFSQLEFWKKLKHIFTCTVAIRYQLRAK